MVIEDLRQIPLLITRHVAAAAEDPETKKYIFSCLDRFYTGDYGEICEDDTAANNADLAAGDGHILARYKGAGALEGDIYIESHFYYKKLDDIDYTNTVIMYPQER